AAVVRARGLRSWGRPRARRSRRLAELGTADRADIEARFAALEADARGQLGDDAGLNMAPLRDPRYQGQSFELTVEAGDVEELPARFHAEHERRYGYRMEDEVVELVNLRLVSR